MDAAGCGEVDHAGRDVKHLALWCGLAVPVLYYGTQFVAIPFYPGYRILSQVASELGSDRSTFPLIFNAGAVVTGIGALIASIGFLRAIPNRILAWLVFLGMVSNGVAGIWAGIHPLPDPRHNPGAIGVGMFVLPLLFLLAMWRFESRSLRIYLIANLVFYALLAPVMGGQTSFPLDEYRGVLQRIAALVMYVPIGVVAGFLLRRVNTSPDGNT